MTRTMHLTGDAAADELLASDANALLLGMLLDQQFPMERAFQGPAIIAERLGRLDVAEIAGMDPEAFTELCSRTPAVHRFPASMACLLYTSRCPRPSRRPWRASRGT